jgi:hypothetical protein
MIKQPTGYYVYAYIDPRTNEPFYIGKGTGNRAWAHLSPYRLRTFQTPFCCELRKMLDEGVPPVIEIVKADLTEQESFASEASLILLTGTRRLETGPLCNSLNGDFREVPESKKGRAIYCWGRVFPSLAAVARDERCEVSKTQLDRRLKAGWSIFMAASTPPIKPKPAPWTLW